MRLGSQFYALTANGVRHIPQRLGNSLVIVVGIAGVVAVLIPILAMYLGFSATIRGDGRADRAVVLSREATMEDESSIPRASVAIIANSPSVRREARGEPMSSAEVILEAPVSRRRDHSDVNVVLRGVGAEYFAIRPELTVVAGRMFHPGTQELLVGAAAHDEFEGTDIGSRIRLQDGDWTVVGIFAGTAGARQSELIADAQTVMAAYKLDSFNSVTVVLASAGALRDFSQTLDHDTQLSVGVQSEPQYLANSARSANGVLRLVTYTVGLIMAVGAFFAALNAMYSAVAARAVELATLRAIGFNASAVAGAVLAEALLLALLGAAIGVAISFAMFSGASISTVGGARGDSQLVYSLAITWPLVAAAIVLACVLGLAGGLLPAMRAARANIADALHEK